MADQNSASYWASLIAQIRAGKNWSQAQFADEIGSNRETVSRWEHGGRIPEPRSRAKIEALAQKLNPASLNGWVTAIAASPFPIILTDRNSYILAASESSGFDAGKNVIEQTPVEERENYKKFSDAVISSGFWDEPGRRFNYEFNTGGQTHAAVVISIGVSGRIYALVQKSDQPVPL
jgi:transcriptional regulator with XRE-family HTH domain